MAKKKNLDKTVVSFVCFLSQWEVIEAAANASESPSVSEYIRSKILKIASKDSGMPLPEVPVIARGGRNPRLTALARDAGLTVPEFKKKLVDDALAAM